VEVKLEFDAIGGDVRSGVRVDRAAYGFWRCVPATDAPAYSPVETRRHSSHQWRTISFSAPPVAMRRQPTG